MAKINPVEALEEFKTKQDETNDAIQRVQPRLREIDEEIEQLQSEIGISIARRVLSGENGRVDGLKKKITELETEKTEILQMAEALRQIRHEQKIEEYALRLAYGKTRLEELMPELEKLKDEIIAKSEATAKLYKKFEDLCREARALRTGLPDLQAKLGQPSGGFPKIPHLQAKIKQWLDQSLDYPEALWKK